MIGPGTGVAPFLGFLEHRRARRDDGRNWLFFGEQHRATDHYYAAELDAYHADGVLDRLDRIAASRNHLAAGAFQFRERILQTPVHAPAIDLQAYGIRRHTQALHCCCQSDAPATFADPRP